MSVTWNKCVRCDWCGRLSRNRLGEYTKPDGVSAGYIRQPDWFRNEDGSNRYTDDGTDICEECAADRCPGCGSDQIVTTTPTVPGPAGWGGRCKACNHHWGMT